MLNSGLKRHKRKGYGAGPYLLSFDGIKYGDDDIYPLLAVNNILGGGMSSRLYQRDKGGKRARLCDILISDNVHGHRPFYHICRHEA